jgi:hypothetical protein
MSAPTELLNTLNGAAGGEAQYDMLHSAVGFIVKTELAQMLVMGAGEVIVQSGGGSETTLIATHD